MFFILIISVKYIIFKKLFSMVMKLANVILISAHIIEFARCRNYDDLSFQVLKTNVSLIICEPFIYFLFRVYRRL